MIMYIYLFTNILIIFNQYVDKVLFFVYWFMTKCLIMLFYGLLLCLSDIVEVYSLDVSHQCLLIISFNLHGNQSFWSNVYNIMEVW